MRRISAILTAQQCAVWVLCAVMCWASSSVHAEPQFIYVVRRGWHIDIGFAAADLAPPLTLLASQLPGARYVFFGFGDRRYLAANHHGVPMMLEALWPGPSLLLTTGLSATPDQAFGESHVIALAATRTQITAAQAFVRASITGVQAMPGPYEGSVYFEGRERYSAVRTCNTWAAEVLGPAGAGYPIHHRGVLFAGQLWRQVKHEAAAESREAAPLSSHH